MPEAKSRVGLRVHWSVVPVGAVAALWVGSPLVLIGYALVLLAHALGHIFLLWRLEVPLGRVEVNGVGGGVVPRDQGSAAERAVAAWGGIIGQGALYLLAWLAMRAGLELPEPVLWGLGTLNFTLAGLNLIPLHPFDGAEAWLLSRRLQERYERQLKAQAIAETLRSEDRRWRSVVGFDFEPPPPSDEPAQRAVASALGQAETLPAEELSVDPSFNYEDGDIPEALLNEVDELLKGIVGGEEG